MSALRDFGKYIAGTAREALAVKGNGAASSQQANAIVKLDPALAGGMQSPDPTVMGHLARAPGSAPEGPITAAPPASAFKTKAKQPKPDPLTSRAVEMLADNLEYLAKTDFRQSPPKPLQTADEPSVHSLLGQAADVVTLWRDQKTLPQAHHIWRQIRPRLSAVLTQPEGLGLPREVKRAREAMAIITEQLGQREAWFKLEDTEEAIEFPDVSEALDLRKAKEFEPSLEQIRTANKEVGRFAKEGSKLGSVTKVIEIYFSANEMKDKLQAFREQTALGKAATAADLVKLLADTTHDALEVYTHGALELAKIAQNPVLIEQLEQRLKFLRKIAGPLALYDAIKSTVELVHAIESEDPRAIAEASSKLAMAIIGVAEAAGAISAGVAAGATGEVLLVWGLADGIIGAAEVYKWSMHARALEALKSMLADAKKIVPDGKKMAAAALLMSEPYDFEDAEAKAENDSYTKHALDSAGQVAKALKRLAGNFMRKSEDSVGHYGALIEALGRPANEMLDKAFMGLPAEDPFSMSEAFKTILYGIKSMAAEGNKLYGDAASGTE